MKRRAACVLASVLISVFAGTNRLRQGYGGPPKLYAKAEVPAYAQSKPRADQFRSGIEVVTVDAVVLERDGRAVSGLSRDDFTLLEDGVAQRITAFEAVEVTARAPALVGVNAFDELRRDKFANPISTNVGNQGRTGRAFVLVFDDAQLTRQEGRAARAALERFLDAGTSPGDLVTLVSTARGTIWHARMDAGRGDLIAALERLEGQFEPDTTREAMSDYEAMRIHVHNDLDAALQVRRRFASHGVAGHERQSPAGPPRQGSPDERNTIVDPWIASRAAEVYSRAVARNRATLGSLERVLAALGASGGRKSVLLLSRGFIHDTETRALRTVVDAARRANAAIHFVDARGLVSSPGLFTAQSGPPIDPRDQGAAIANIALDAEGAVSLAEESGGVAIRNTNDLAAGVVRIATESRAYYLIAYEPANQRRDGAFRRIEVRTRRPGLRVRARQGYYAPALGDTNVAGVADAIRRQIDSPFDAQDVPVRVATYLFQPVSAARTRLILVAEVDVRACALTERDNRLTGKLDVAIAVSDPTTGDVLRRDRTVEMSLLPGTPARLARTWYAIREELDVPAGANQMRVVVRDAASGRTGSVTHGFRIPAGDGLRISTPILTDVVQREQGARPVPVPIARRQFAATDTLYCQFQVYGARSRLRPPDVAAAHAIRTPAGRVIRQASPTRIVPGADGSLVRLIGVALRDVPPGDYDLVLSITNAASGASLEMREPFSVIRPESSTGSADQFQAIAKEAAEAFAGNRFSEAVDLYAQALTINPTWEEGRWQLGAANYELHRYEQARDAFRSVVDLNAKHGPAWAMKGVCEYELGSHDAALADLLRALTLGFAGKTQLRDVARYHTAVLLTRIEEYEHALQLLSNFGQEGNESPRVIEALGIALLRLPLLPRELPASQADVVKRAGRAGWLAAARRGAAAQTAFEELCARYPRTPNVHYAFGMFLLLDDPARALDEFKRELDVSPTHVAARVQTALEYVRRGEYDAARPWAAATVRDAPTQPEPRRALGRVLLETGDVPGAIEQLEIGVELAPESPEMRYLLARAYRRAGRSADADRQQAEFKKLVGATHASPLPRP
jgi:VWFA-related protein